MFLFDPRTQCYKMEISHNHKFRGWNTIKPQKTFRPVLILGTIVGAFLLLTDCGGSNISTAPSDLQATVVSSTHINLDWSDNSFNEDGFEIERKTGAEGKFTQIGAVVGDKARVGDISYSDTGLDCATTYYYRVRAYNWAGNSSYSNKISVSTQACVIPAAPSALQSAPVVSGQVFLSWKDNSDNEDGFKIEKKTDASGTYSLIQTTASDVNFYSDTGLSAGATYYYRVYAYNSVGNSSYSNEVTTITHPPRGSMASIPAGCFFMGDALGEGFPDERPVHTVCLSAFQMDIYKVTNAQYQDCVDAGGCTAPENISSAAHSSYFGNSTFNNFPVIWVSWPQANTYCVWAGGRLPTEAEWEYSARGGLSVQRYPWGNTAPVCTPLAIDGAQTWACSPNDTIQVGSFAANGYGLYDMAGNVWEWVNDYYDSEYYSTSPTQDPPGPFSGFYRVFRGGSWLSWNPTDLRVANRDHQLPPSSQLGFLGFRCAK